MLKNFIEDLCQSEDLIDVGGLGKASQSSISKWSQPNDAQRALSPIGNKDFTFHTEKEKNPWWQVEFSNEIRPWYILINNRRNEEYEYIASKIKVTVSNSNDEVIVHKGIVFFGALPNRLPLILPLNGKINVHSIKIEIENNESSYLHLSNIHVLTQKPIRSKAGLPIFFANRVDGFGMRLCAVLVAMIYARKFGSDFMFSWQHRNSKVYDNHHMTDTAKDIFSKNFIERHLVEKDYIDKLGLVNAAKHNKGFENDIFDGYLCDYSNRNDFSESNLDFSYLEAFNTIEFNKDLLMAKRLAESVRLNKKSVGIHLRSGDIVYEQYRLFHGFHYKVTPAYIIIPLIQKYKSEGYDIVLMGQEESFCRYLSEFFGVRYSGDLINEKFNEAQKGMFDITLFSRLSLIISMGSAFTILSSLIGKSKIKKYSEVLTYNEIVDGFKSFENGIGKLDNHVLSDLYKSFSYVNFYREFYNDLSVKNKLEIIDKCIKLEPDNLLNQFKKMITNLYSKDYLNTNKEILEFIQSKNGKEFINIFVVKRESLPPVDYIFHEYIEEFKELASKGVVSIAMILLKHELKTGKKINADFYDRVIENAIVNKYFGVSMLEKELIKIKI